MKSLTPDWITDGLIDFEYKKYMLLAYLQQINKNFNACKLYPFLTELITQYNNLIALKTNKNAVLKRLPASITKIDFERFVIEYEEILDKEEYIYEIEQIIEFAIPIIEQYMKDGHEIHAFVEDKITISPVGLVTLYNDEGFILISGGKCKEVNVYEYRMTFYRNSMDKLRGIRTFYVTTFRKSIYYTYEVMKRDLIRSHPEYSNPATYIIECSTAFPLNETLLPVAKKAFVSYLSEAA